MSPNITPLPWDGSDIPNPCIKSGDNFVAVFSGPNAEANRDFVLKATAAHAQLVEALKRLLKAEKAFIGDTVGKSSIMDELELAESEAEALLSTLETK